MKTVDFQRSYLRFRTDWKKKPSRTASHAPAFTLNNCRILLECRLRVEDRETGSTHTFVMGASCKTERVGVDNDVWLEPNADFVPIFSDEEFLMLKTYSLAGQEVNLYPPGSGKQSERQHGNRAEAYDRSSIDIVECEAEVLESVEAIIEASFETAPLVSRTVITQGRYTATIEHPVKTLNANERDNVYQTDTGPVLFPDLSVEPNELLPRMDMAYSAFNGPDWAEFIVRVPTKVSDELSVYHYSKPARLDCENQLLKLSTR